MPVAGICLVLSIGLFVSACETSFDPFEDSELALSVMGYLDVSADTQYVRVEQLRDSLLLGAGGPIDATVSLTDEATGERVVWQDSIFTFGDNIIGYNYWSPMTLLPSHRYLFEVEPVLGNTVSGRVTMPDPFELDELPEITCVTLNRTCVDLPFFQLDFTGMQRAASMLMIYRYPDFMEPTGCKELRIHYWEEAFDSPDGKSVVIEWRDDLERLIGSWPNIPVPPTFATVDIFVAAGGDEWPDFTGISAETLAIPDAFTTVENGIGFLAGVMSQRIRLWDNESFCEFRMDEAPPGM